MMYIAHRANICGKNINTENTKKQIVKCFNLNLLVEIDLWHINNQFFLGHDEPIHKINTDFLLKNKHLLLCHAKNESALFEMIQNKLHCFWHEEDDYTITSQGLIWAYPGSKINKNTIAVMPEISTYEIKDLILAYGICSDNIQYYQKLTRNQ